MEALPSEGEALNWATFGIFKAELQDRRFGHSKLSSRRTLQCPF